MKGKKNIADIIVIVIFLACIFLPTFLFPFFKDRIGEDTSENRVLAAKPELSLADIDKFPEQFNNYYDDHLPFRSVLRKAWVKINFFLLRDSTDDKVLIGKSDSGLDESWLFYKAENNGNPVRAAQGYLKLSDKDFQSYKKRISELTKWIRSKGIEYYVLLIPNKENIYKEYLPSSVKMSDEKGRIDVAVEKFIENGIDNLIYPKNALIEGKKVAQTYYKQDTHWNDWGAYLGFKEYMAVAEPDYKVEDVDVDIKRMVTNKDLSIMLGAYNYFVDNIPLINYKTDSRYYKESSGNQDGVVITRNESAPIKKTVFLAGDSFRTAITDYFAKTYEKCVILHKSSYKPSMVEEHKPDIIISEGVERHNYDALVWGDIGNF